MWVGRTKAIRTVAEVSAGGSPIRRRDVVVGREEGRSFVSVELDEELCRSGEDEIEDGEKSVRERGVEEGVVQADKDGEFAGEVDVVVELEAFALDEFDEVGEGGGRNELEEMIDCS